MSKYANITRFGGEIQTHVPTQTFIRDAAGNEIATADFARDWLAHSKGLEVVEVSDIGIYGTRIVVRKIADEVEVPELTLEALGAGKPPIRDYAWRPQPSPSPAPRRRRRQRLTESRGGEAPRDSNSVRRAADCFRASRRRRAAKRAAPPGAGMDQC